MNIDRLRDDTPGVGSGIYLNTAGCSLMPRPVIGAVQDYFALEASAGGYPAMIQQTQALEAVYASLASLINAKPNEIALMGSHTDAWQSVFYGLSFSEGDRILTGRAEYGANYVAFMQMRKRTGCEIEIIPCDTSGATDCQALEKMIDDRVKLIAITWIPTNGGLVNPAAEIGKVAQAHAIPYLLDACQAVGQMPVDVEALGCDFLSATGRKWLRGPKGTGFLYVREARLAGAGSEPAMIDDFGALWTKPDEYELRGDARRFETHEYAPALRLGLGAAAEYALNLGLDRIQDRVRRLAASLREELARIPGITVRDLGTEKAGLVTFSHDSIEPGAINRALEAEAIQLKVVPREGALLDSTARRLGEMVRASPHYFNSEQELETFLKGLHKAISA
ncbi:MAG: aminotransferase class V-fold PLP-dependent enzyme [Methyloligellaceae bacterium]